MWNANGIHNKTVEIIEFLRRNQTQVLILNETRLHAGYIFKIAGYTILEKRGLNGHGGVAIAVRSDVPYRNVKLDQPALTTLEAVAIQLQDNTVIATWYNSPSNKIRQEHLDAFFRLSRKVVLAGDFNATHTSWGCHRNNPNGTTLHNYLLNSNVILFHPDTPTHYPSNGTTPTVIDLILAANTYNIQEPTTEAMPSDHSAINFQLGAAHTNMLERIVLDYSKANWNKFRSILQAEPMVHSIQDTQTLEDAVLRITKNINAAANKSIPNKTINPHKYSELPPDILSKIRERNMVRRNYQRARNPALLEDFKRLNHQIKTAIAEHRNKTYADRLKKINPADGSLWRLNRHLRKPYHPVSSIHDDGCLTALSEQDVANKIASTFQNNHCIPDTDRETQDMVDREVTSYLLCNPLSRNSPTITSPNLAQLKILSNNHRQLKRQAPTTFKTFSSKIFPTKQ